MRILLLLFAALLVQAVQAKPYQYKIHAGDILSISIWNEDSLQRELQVLPDGTISFPLAGVISVEGKAL
jgi:polysaccharide export outer membrane protein